jgi:8-oxo-dGTP diphosphatase
MKHIEVVAGIIKDGDKIFATQRGYGDFKDGWEFPGGKMEPGETCEQALARELKEELADLEGWFKEEKEAIEGSEG